MEMEMALLNHLGCFVVVVVLILWYHGSEKQLKEEVPEKSHKATINSNKDALSHIITPQIVKKTTRVTIVTNKDTEPSPQVIKWIPNFNHIADMIITHYKLIKFHTKLKDEPSLNVFSYLLFHLHLAFYHYLNTLSQVQEVNDEIVEILDLYKTHGFHKLGIIPNLKPWFESLSGAELDETMKFEVSLPMRKESIRNPYPERIDFNTPRGKSPAERYECTHNKHLHQYAQTQAILDGYYSHTTTETFPNFNAILLAVLFVFNTNSIDKRRFISSNKIKDLGFFDQGNIRISFMNIVGGSIDFEKIDELFGYVVRDTFIDFNANDGSRIRDYLMITPRLLRHLKQVAQITESVVQYTKFESRLCKFEESLLSLPLFTSKIKMIKPGIRSILLNEMSLQEYSTTQEIISKIDPMNISLFHDSIVNAIIWDNVEGITPGFFYKDDRFYYYDRRGIDPWFKKGKLYHSQVFNKELEGFTLS